MLVSSSDSTFNRADQRLVCFGLCQPWHTDGCHNQQDDADGAGLWFTISKERQSRPNDGGRSDDEEQASGHTSSQPFRFHRIRFGTEIAKGQWPPKIVQWRCRRQIPEEQGFRTSKPHRALLWLQRSSRQGLTSADGIHDAVNLEPGTPLIWAFDLVFYFSEPMFPRTFCRRQR